MISRAVFFLLIASPLVLCNDYTKALENLDRKLHDYDKRIRPGVGEKPINVTCSMYIIRAYDFNEKTSSMKIDTYFRQAWKDDRLTFSPSGVQINAGEDLEKVIWKPDTFFASASNEKIHDVPSRNVFVRINENGDVFLSYRISAEVFCEPKKKDFPKTCVLEIESYGFSTEDIMYGWKSSSNNSSKPLGNDEKQFLNSDYDLLELKEDSNVIKLTNGSYSRLVVNMTINRA